MDQGTDALLKAREATHGSFASQARLAQALKSMIRSEAQPLSAGQQEALDMIASKLARIACGDAGHADHWCDIAGYAALGGGLWKPGNAS